MADDCRDQWRPTSFVSVRASVRSMLSSGCRRLHDCPPTRRSKASTHSDTAPSATLSRTRQPIAPRGSIRCSTTTPRRRAPPRARPIGDRPVRETGVSVEWVLETHIHADHRRHRLRERAVGGRSGIGDRLPDVQQAFRRFRFRPRLPGRRQRVRPSVRRDEAFALGSIAARALHTPGHTPACVSYLIGDAVFIGDTFFMPDAGTARADFPAPTPPRCIARCAVSWRCRRRHGCSSATTTAPADANRHGKPQSPSSARTTSTSTTACRGRVRRTADRPDKTLSMPVLIIPAVQVNLRAGELPAPSDNGVRYLRVPMNVL